MNALERYAYAPPLKSKPSMPKIDEDPQPIALTQVRPQTAPSAFKKPESNSTKHKCMICARRIFTSAYAEIGSNTSNSSREYICTAECFAKFMHKDSIEKAKDKDKKEKPT